MTQTTTKTTISRANYRHSVVATTDQDGYVTVIFGNDTYRMTAHAAEMLASEIAGAAQVAVQRPKRLRVTDSRPWHMERSDGGAEAVKYTKAEGAAFSGWVVRSTRDSFSYSDPIPTKREARRALLAWDTEAA